MSDRTFRTVYPLWIILNVTIPVLIVVLLIVAIGVGGLRGRDLFEVAWCGSFIAFAGYFVIRRLFLAHTLTIHEDGRLTFKRIVSDIVLHPNEIAAVKRSWFKNYLAVHSAHGLILLPQWEWHGIHSLVGHLRRNNPAVELSGVPGEPDNQGQT